MVLLYGNFNSPFIRSKYLMEGKFDALSTATFKVIVPTRTQDYYNEGSPPESKFWTIQASPVYLFACLLIMVVYQSANYNNRTAAFGILIPNDWWPFSPH